MHPECSKATVELRVVGYFSSRTRGLQKAVGAVWVTFDAESAHSPKQQRQGWQAILNNDARHIGGRTPSRLATFVPVCGASPPRYTKFALTSARMHAI
jgi:hypothetical protein